MLKLISLFEAYWTFNTCGSYDSAGCLLKEDLLSFSFSCIFLFLEFIVKSSLILYRGHLVHHLTEASSFNTAFLWLVAPHKQEFEQQVGGAAIFKSRDYCNRNIHTLWDHAKPNLKCLELTCTFADDTSDVPRFIRTLATLCK